MKNYILTTFLTCVFNFGCGSGDSDDWCHISKREKQNNYVSPEFAFYYNKFNNTFNKNAYKIGIDFGETSPEVAGVCYYFGNKDGYIKINKDYWLVANENEKENLIFHELGHCLEGLDHDDAIIEIEPKIKIYKSIMNSFIIGGYWFYENYKDHYFKELNEKLSP